MPKAAQDTNLVRFSQISGDKLSESEISELAKFPDISDERFRLLSRKAFPEIPLESINLTLGIARKLSEGAEAACEFCTLARLKYAPGTPVFSSCSKKEVV